MDQQLTFKRYLLAASERLSSFLESCSSSLYSDFEVVQNKSLSNFCAASGTVKTEEVDISDLILHLRTALISVVQERISRSRGPYTAKNVCAEFAFRLYMSTCFKAEDSTLYVILDLLPDEIASDTTKYLELEICRNHYEFKLQQLQ